MDKQESRSLGRILWRRKWIVIATALIALAASIGFTLVRTPHYQATVVLVRGQQSVDVALFGTVIYPYEDVQRDLVTTAEALDSGRVADLVKQSTGVGLSAGQLLQMVTATPSTESNTITVKVVGPDAEQTALVANEFAQQTIELRKQADRAAVVTAREALETQVALMTEAELASERGQALQTRIEQLTILEGLENGGYALWQTAETPQTPVSPRPFRDAGAGLAIGIVLGLILAVGADRIDRRLKDHADFEREFGLPILALVPRNGRKWGRSEQNSDFIGFTDRTSASAEAYRLLRSNLQYFDTEKGLRTILITSALPGEAKTVTATNLALSLAISGARAALVDCDLRNPLMHRYLYLDNSVGLSSVLAGAVSLEDAVKKVSTAQFLPADGRAPLSPSGGRPGLDQDFLCLTSGPLPPNPAELLASTRFAETLTALAGMADYVLVDSAPVLLVADAVSVASRVDGVIVVSRAGTATIDQAREVRTTLDRVGARTIGLVISGVKAPSNHGYRQGYYPQGA